MKVIGIMLCTLLFGWTSNAQQTVSFRLNDLENTSRTFDELKGQNLTLIDFWASWCVPCKKSIPELNKIYAKYKSKGVEIIGINCDGPRSIAKVGPLSKTLQISYPVLTDLNSDVMQSLNLSAFPTLILVEKSGKIKWIHEGYVTGDAEIIQAEIDKHLNVD